MIEIQSHRGNVARLFHGDSVALLNDLPRFDAMVTDPPYGIAFDSASLPGAPTFAGKKIQGDAAPFDPTPWLELVGARPLIMWGANNFIWRMPHRQAGWIVWDKRCSMSADRVIGSPFELAWCSNPKLYKIARIQHGAYLNADRTGKREHPTQKPIELFSFCYEQLRLPAGSTIFDPYMGSGTAGVAALKTGYNFVGVEIEDGFFEIARRRIQEEANRMTLL